MPWHNRVYRESIADTLKEAIDKSEINSQRSSKGLERKFYSRSKSKNEYMSHVAKYIINDRDESIKMRHFQKTGESGEPQMAQQITSDAQILNASQTAAVATNVMASQTAAVATNVNAQQTVFVPTRAEREKYFADYLAMQDSPDTIITWQDKKYMNMKAKIEDYSCIKINTGLDPSLFRWSSATENQNSDNEDSDDDSYAMGFASSSGFSHAYYPSSQICHPRIPTVDIEDSDNLGAEGSSGTRPNSTGRTPHKIPRYVSPDNPPSNPVISHPSSPTFEEKDNDKSGKQGSSGTKSKLTMSCTTLKIPRILSPNYPPSPPSNPRSPPNKKQDSDNFSTEGRLRTRSELNAGLTPHKWRKLNVSHTYPNSPPSDKLDSESFDERSKRICESTAVLQKWRQMAANLTPPKTFYIAQPETFYIAPPETSCIDPPETSCIDPPETSCIDPSETSCIAPPETADIAPPETADIAPSETSDPPETSDIAPPVTSDIAPPETSCIDPPETSCIDPPETSCIDPPETADIDPPETADIAPPIATSSNPAKVDTEKDTNAESDRNDDVSYKDNKQTEQISLCSVCLDNNVTTVMIPCGHITLCCTCATNHYGKYKRKICPICRTKVQKCMRIYKT